jgi:hypothetical protein
MTQMPWPKAPEFPPDRYCEVQVDKLTREYGHFKDVPDGSLVRLVRPIINDHTRTRFYKDSGPGFYPNTSYLVARLFDGTEKVFFSTFLKGDRSYDHRNVKVANLPETEFWEHDEVVYSHPEQGPMEGTIDGVQYREHEGFVRVTYNFESSGGGGYWGQDASAFQLIRRGKLYGYKVLGVKPCFDDLKEEAQFYLSLREATQLKNPACPPKAAYQWSYVEFLNALVAGDADSLRVSNGFFGAGKPPEDPFERSSAHSPYRFHDREVGERLRAEALAGFREDIARFVPAPRPSVPSQSLARMAAKMEAEGKPGLAAVVRGLE